MCIHGILPCWIASESLCSFAAAAAASVSRKYYVDYTLNCICKNETHGKYPQRHFILFVVVVILLLLQSHFHSLCTSYSCLCCWRFCGTIPFQALFNSFQAFGSFSSVRILLLDGDNGRCLLEPTVHRRHFVANARHAQYSFREFHYLC